MRGVFRFPEACERAAPVEQWLNAQAGELGELGREWFSVMRRCGSDVRELMHDGYPTACVHDGAFAYVGVFTNHVNIGFFHGTALPDPAKLLQGTGKYMRHVKLVPGHAVDRTAIEALIASAYHDMQARLRS